MRTKNGITLVQCPRCFGRGYQPEGRRNGGPGFYARTCPRCGGSGMAASGPSGGGFFLRYNLGDANAAYLARTLGYGARLAWALGQPQDGE